MGYRSYDTLAIAPPLGRVSEVNFAEIHGGAHTTIELDEIFPYTDSSLGVCAFSVVEKASVEIRRRGCVILSPYYWGA